MIARLDGELEAVAEGAAHLRVGDLLYEVMIPACDQMRLGASIGSRIRLHTLHYLEGQGQGTSFWPRLIGFATAEERTFFELFTSVKGIGNRRALRSLQLPIATVAEAIANGDTTLLQSLPEVGKKTAESIVLELKDKVNRFLGLHAMVEAKPADAGRARLIADATTILTQLGEVRPQARVLVDRALTADPTIESADALVTAALALRALG